MGLQRAYGYGQGTDIQVQEYGTKNESVRFCFGRGVKRLEADQRARTVDADCAAAFAALVPARYRPPATPPSTTGA